MTGNLKFIDRNKRVKQKFYLFLMIITRTRRFCCLTWQLTWCAVAVSDIKEVLTGKECPHVRDKNKKVFSPLMFSIQHAS